MASQEEIKNAKIALLESIIEQCQGVHCEYHLEIIEEELSQLKHGC
jgi:ABC-type transporter Mla MlaB component